MRELIRRPRGNTNAQAAARVKGARDNPVWTPILFRKLLFPRWKQVVKF
jgi:hypothetical protein